MTDFFKKSKNAAELRNKHNGDLIRRMRNGESLNAIDSKASWFPPRPVIEKDKKEMARLYTEEAAKNQGISTHEKEARERDSKVVPFTLGNAS
jgi:hypothetical protein